MFGAFGELAFGEVGPAGPLQVGDNRKGVGAFGENAFGQQEGPSVEGVEISLVSDQWQFNNPAPSLRSGAQLTLPVSSFVFHDEAVRISISATVALPDDQFIFHDTDPQISAGAIPASEIKFVDQAISIRSGARIFLAASQIVTNGPRIELNARRRRVKTTVVQS